jgi:hypothetical protein
MRVAIALVVLLMASMVNAGTNVFLEGENVKVAGQGKWVLKDIDGKTVKQGAGEEVGKLGVGYYELFRGDAKTTVGVIAPLAAPTPEDSPIGLDVAMAWFYKEAEMAEVARLCKLAGVNWVRDRLAWGEMEPRKGEFAKRTRYDASERIQAAAGLRVLQVNHSSPGWAAKDGRRFPPDLRDVHRFYREMAQRWKGQVMAFEPWNEGDISMFGGHTGCEMATLQKAAYLGLKEGNPNVIACLNVFADQRPGQLADLAANEAWPYFDTCNLHHYIGIEKFPGRYAAFRAICAGRPLWTTEFAMPVQWADEKTKEPSDKDLRNQAQRVPVSFAGALHEGCAAAFYFLLPDYVEGKTQFGIIHKDLTPRPAYVALAAAGRLLAGAKPLGRSKGDAAFHVYWFDARPDGVNATVIVAWDWEKPTDLVLPQPGRVFDIYGRVVAAGAERVTVTGQPVYIVLPAGSVAASDLEKAPPMPARSTGKASKIVLQALWPAEKINLGQSAYRAGDEAVPLAAYNFSDHAVKPALKVEGTGIDLPAMPEIAPGERKEVIMRIAAEAGLRTITIRAEGDEPAVVSFRVVGK